MSQGRLSERRKLIESKFHDFFKNCIFLSALYFPSLSCRYVCLSVSFSPFSTLSLSLSLGLSCGLSLFFLSVFSDFRGGRVNLVMPLIRNRVDRRHIMMSRFELASLLQYTFWAGRGRRVT